MSKVKGLVVLVAGLVLSGCVGMRDSIPIMGESEDGKQVVIAHATRTRLYALSKAAEKIELWQVSSDKGVTMKGSDANSDSTSLVQVLERGIEIGSALASARVFFFSFFFVVSSEGMVGGASGGEEADIVVGNGVAYSTDGYGGEPGASGVGVYGRPSCSRCRSYRSAHPDVQMINIDNAASRSSMWAALKSRGYAGSSVGLPVVITADAYTVAAK